MSASVNNLRHTDWISDSCFLLVHKKSPAGVSIPLFKPRSLLLSADWLNQIPFMALVSLLVPLWLSVTFRAAFRPKLPLSFMSSLKKPCKHPVKRCQALNSLAWFHLSYPCSLPSGASPLAYKSNLPGCRAVCSVVVWAQVMAPDGSHQHTKQSLAGKYQWSASSPKLITWIVCLFYHLTLF